MKAPKPRISIQLILDSLPSPHQIPHILGVHNPKLRSGRKEYVADVLDERPLFALTDVELVEDTAVRLAEIEDVAEHFLNELLDLAGSDDWWIGIAKWTNEKLTSEGHEQRSEP